MEKGGCGCGWELEMAEAGGSWWLFTFLMRCEEDEGVSSMGSSACEMKNMGVIIASYCISVCVCVSCSRVWRR